MSASERTGNWFLSSKGRRIYPFDMRPEDVDIEEIAAALSKLCRFNGHTRSFYSVAQHSVLVAQSLPVELCLVGLLHDATEAYCGDLIRPIKLEMPTYRYMEDRMWEKIAQRFSLPFEIPGAVKIADTRALFTERRDLLPPGEWILPPGDPRAFDERIEPLEPAAAERLFLYAFDLCNSIERCRKGEQELRRILAPGGAQL